MMTSSRWLLFIIMALFPLLSYAMSSIFENYKTHNGKSIRVFKGKDDRSVKFIETNTLAKIVLRVTRDGHYSMRETDRRSGAWCLRIDKNYFIQWDYVDVFIKPPSKIYGCNIVLLIMPRKQHTEAPSASAWAVDKEFFLKKVNLQTWLASLNEQDEYIVMTMEHQGFYPKKKSTKVIPSSSAVEGELTVTVTTPN